MSKWDSKRRRCMIAVIILCSFVGCDQATKRLATDMLQNESAKTYMSNTIRLEYALNPGGFLSIGASLPPVIRRQLFIGFNVVLLTGVTVFLLKNWRTPFVTFASFTYILAGGIGNLIDRVTNDGMVVDFINLGIGPVRTGVFNVADIGVTLGGLTLVACSLRSDSPRECPSSDSHSASDS